MSEKKRSAIWMIAESFEFGDVAREEVAARRIELLEEPIEHERGNRIVDRGLPIVRALDDVAHELAHAAMALRRRQILRARRSDRSRDGRLRRTREESAHDQKRGQAEK
mgnify:CR=1 FL=1